MSKLKLWAGDIDAPKLGDLVKVTRSNGDVHHGIMFEIYETNTYHSAQFIMLLVEGTFESFNCKDLWDIIVIGACDAVVY